MNNTVRFVSSKLKNKLTYLFFGIIVFCLIAILYFGYELKSFHNIEDAFEYYNKCEVGLTVEGEKSTLVLGIKDGTIVRDFFYKNKNGYSSVVGFDTKNVFCSSIDGFSIDLLYVKKTGEYYIRVYSSAEELSEISDSCSSVFYSLQPYPSSITKAKIYYAFIREFDDNYYLKLNDELIVNIQKNTGESSPPSDEK